MPPHRIARDRSSSSPPFPEYASQPGHGEDDVAVGNGLEHLFAQPFGPEEGALLLARGTERSPATRVWDQIAQAARPTRAHMSGRPGAPARPPDAAGRVPWRTAPRTRARTPRGAARRDGGEAGTRGREELIVSRCCRALPGGGCASRRRRGRGRRRAAGLRPRARVGWVRRRP